MFTKHFDLKYFCENDYLPLFWKKLKSEQWSYALVICLCSANALAGSSNVTMAPNVYFKVDGSLCGLGIYIPWNGGACQQPDYYNPKGDNISWSHNSGSISVNGSATSGNGYGYANGTYSSNYDAPWPPYLGGIGDYEGFSERISIYVRGSQGTAYKLSYSTSGSASASVTDFEVQGGCWPECGIAGFSASFSSTKTASADNHVNVLNPTSTANDSFNDGNVETGLTSPDTITYMGENYSLARVFDLGGGDDYLTYGVVSMLKGHAEFHGDFAVDVTRDTALNIVDAYFDPAPKWNDIYQLDTIVKLKSQAPQNVKVQVTETITNNVTLGLGDKFIAQPTEASQSLIPYMPTKIIFPQYGGIDVYYGRHSWDWMDTKGKSCFEWNNDIFLPTAYDILVEYGKTLPGIGEAFFVTADLIKGGLDIKELAIKGIMVVDQTYNYHIEAKTDDGSSDARTISATVEVTPYKKAMYHSYQVLGNLATAATTKGIQANTWPVALGFFAVEGVLMKLSCTAYDGAKDPDSNYMQIAQVESVNLPSLDAIPESSAKQLAKAWINSSGNQKALYTSLGRYEGAKEAGDAVWAKRQLNAAIGFQKIVSSHFERIKSLSNNVVDELNLSYPNITTSDLATASANIHANGLPELEKNILTELGFKSTDIDSASQFTESLLNILVRYDQVQVNQVDSVDIGKFITDGTSMIVGYNNEVGNFILNTVNDVNKDGIVDCSDLKIVKNAFGKRSGQSNFNQNADINGDCVVDIRDLSSVSRQLPIGVKCM